MKKIIIILGTILLGVFIVSTLIMGGGSNDKSLRNSAKSITEKCNSLIDSLILENAD